MALIDPEQVKGGENVLTNNLGCCLLHGFYMMFDVGLSHKTLGFTLTFFSPGLTQPTFLDLEQIEQSCPGSFRDKA